MRPILFTLICTFIYFNAFAQVNEPCTGDSIPAKIRGSDMHYFSQQGMDLSKYNWADNNTNCHFNLMLDNYRSAKNNAIWGGVSLGFGGLLLPASVVTLAWIADVGVDSSGLAATIIICSVDAALIVGGIALVKKSISRRWEMSYQRNEVAKYYRKNNLFR